MGAGQGFRDLGKMALRFCPWPLGGSGCLSQGVHGEGEWELARRAGLSSALPLPPTMPGLSGCARGHCQGREGNMKDACLGITDRGYRCLFKTQIMHKSVILILSTDHVPGPVLNTMDITSFNLPQSWRITAGLSPI